MAGCARNEIVREGEIGVYHTWSRCVQRAYLCGDDPLTGVNYDYRRQRIQSLLGAEGRGRGGAGSLGGGVSRGAAGGLRVEDVGGGAVAGRLLADADYGRRAAAAG